MNDDLIERLERFIAALRHRQAYRPQYLIDLLLEVVERLKQQRQQ